VRVTVNQSWNNRASLQVNNPRFPAGVGDHRRNTEMIRSPAIAIACTIVKSASTVMILPFLRTISATLSAALAETGVCVD
jgi:hypothetical protein